VATKHNPLRNRVVVAGVGYGPVAKRSPFGELELTLIAARDALSNAGLTSDDVDGIVSYPDRSGGNTFAGPAVTDVQRGIGLDHLRFWQGSAAHGCAQLAAPVSAAYAIHAGAADVVLCYRTVKAQRRADAAARRSLSPSWLESQYYAPYGIAASAPRWALMAQRFLHDTGQDAEALAAVVLNNRGHALLNPRAIWYDQPLTKEDYFDAVMVSDPLRITDCDMFVDASVAVILARADRAADLAHPPAYIEAIAHAPGPVLDDHQIPGLHNVSRWIAPELWAKTDLTVDDIDVSQVYDGFSFQALQWLEDFGFAPRGEAGARVAAGEFTFGGRVPICTDGGQLGVGRYHGMEKLAEGARQLWGGAGDAQVDGAEVSFVGAGGGVRGAAMILTTG
jgi:acetyl-CoA acetyltransferase